MSGGSRVQHSSAALERFTELIARHDAGEQVDFELELRSPPELAGELEQLHTSWQRLRDLLRSVRPEPGDLRAAEREAGGEPLVLDPRSQRMLALLSRFRGREPRYEVLGEIARGGMGMVLRVREKGLERELAMKRSFGIGELAPPMQPLRAQLLRRLLDEAWILSRLDHPWIVQLHELGIDPQGRVYFTMPLVRGRTLTEIFALARAGREGWNLERALSLLQRVAEALSFAHTSGIVHRDLKPDNVMVGRFGELQVMDWGLARSLGPAAPARAAGTHPTEAAELELDSALTLGGDVLGTPAYMAPEQAQGHSAEASPLADVYALGAMLYELLAGERPYHEHGRHLRARELLEYVKAGPPWPIDNLAGDQPAGLLAICTKAMQREPSQRYASMESFANDLRAFRGGRVVLALESGAWAELRRWIGRNKRVAAAIGFGFLSLCAAAAITFVVERRADLRVRFWADRRGPAALRAVAKGLWPARPEKIADFDAWLAEARELVAREENFPRELAQLRQRERPPTAERLSVARARLEAERATVFLELRGVEDELDQLAKHSDELGARQGRLVWLERREALRKRQAELDRRQPDDLVHEYADPADTRRDEQLSALIEELRGLTDPRPFEDTIADVERRREIAASIERRSITEHRAEWSETTAAIADPAQSPRYALPWGVPRITPQTGLVPLGRDPATGLWEFGDLYSGELPVRGSDGRLRFDERSGLVFVLLPGGRTTMGALHEGESLEGVDLEPDPDAAPQEGKAHANLRLEAFFLSKYEMSQAQWQRLTGASPSYYSVGKKFEQDPTVDWCYPVEHISWDRAREVLGCFGFELPTEAQWEYAARGGTRTRFWWGPDLGGACGRVNVHGCDVAHVPMSKRVDDFEPNPWGFYCILGNVGEWTADNYWTTYRWSFADDGTARQLSADSGLRVARGGDYGCDAKNMRVTRRVDVPPDQPVNSIGVRPMRRIQRMALLSAATPAAPAAQPPADRR
ncbi:MAG: SUMF1/EgtB/PvdO family nonheme iron enzyme [Planctomycetes bacterium]|nr:SUMF1/EgtB/PvdO family nonheme iron enzyme [Planctomycetota bacterium]